MFKSAEISPQTGQPRESRLLLPAASLCQRELVRFVRQGNRVASALATPILFWLFIGAGMGRSFHSDAAGGDNFMEYFFPGTLAMILLFTAIFSTISIIEDRREGFLQSVLVAPVPPMAVVLGKLLGGTVLAAGQGMIFLAMAPLAGIKLSVGSFVLASLMMVLVSFALTGVGFCIAWRMSSTQGFHAIMMLFLMPMWFLSGALFPAEGAGRIMRIVMECNPLTYGVSAIRQALYIGSGTSFLHGWPVNLGITLVFAAVMFGIASRVARGRVAADLQ